MPRMYPRSRTLVNNAPALLPKREPRGLSRACPCAKIRRAERDPNSKPQIVS